MIYHCMILMLMMAIIGSSESKRRWDYELVQASAYSLDESKIKVEMHLQREGRGNLGFSGSFDWKYEMDNTTMLEVKILQSYSGNENDFRPIPFSMPQKRIIEYKDLYNTIIYPNIELCSNFPFKGNGSFLPWPQMLYEFNMCKLDKGSMPEVLAESTYRIVYNFSGQVNWSITLAFSTKII